MRVYLDHAATTPLRPEARSAMIAAMEAVGNPSSVHAEGRAAKAIVERARLQVAQAVGGVGAEVVFTSGATEAAALALAGRGLVGAAIEHDAVRAWIDLGLPVDRHGRVAVTDPARTALQLANSETGVVQVLPAGLAVSDITQGFGKLPFAFNWSGVGMVFLSAHKIGGPKGVGALVFAQGTEIAARIRGGGQEMGRRAGTENVIGIAGFGAAAAAAEADLGAGRWEKAGELRNILEQAIEAEVPETIFVGKETHRLCNVSNFVTPGWKGETQVMAMDLAGFAVSAGSACSSGKVKVSQTLIAMGFDAGAAGSAIRVSLGLDNTEEQVLRFAQAWTTKRKALRARVA